MSGGAGAGGPVTPGQHQDAGPTTSSGGQEAHRAPGHPEAAPRIGDGSVPPAPPSPADAAAASARASVVAVEPASADVDSRADSSGLPGQHRGGFSRLPTAPVAVTVPSGPDPDTEVHWDPAPQAGAQRGIAAWALAFALVGLVVSMFVGWGFPIGLVGVVSGFIALRRPTESRALAGWAIVLGTASLIYSAGWLWFAATQANLIY